MGMLAAFGLSAGAIFVAEMGDKTQLVALSLASRYRAFTVLLGITIATLAVHAVSVLIAEMLGWAIPLDWATLVAGLAFLGFGAWSLRGEELSERDERRAASRTLGSGLLTVVVIFFVAELGDKTMLATIAVGTQAHWLPVWIGSTVGMVLADALAVALGAFIAKKVPERAVRLVSAGIFFVAGTVMAAQGLRLVVGG